ncbi:DUF6907 domain-containing protein [Nonomuraea sp. NPDC050451]|uniref:DUF6907 domain-containing protein n=1 Tax=Nonomuraea sp. NPDC050451 TaxID=3364364 RepID=UPI0037B0DD50
MRLLCLAVSARALVELVERILLRHTAQIIEPLLRLHANGRIVPIATEVRLKVSIAGLPGAANTRTGPQHQTFPGGRHVTTSSLNCPTWCTAQHHRPDYITHTRDVAELAAGSLNVQIAIFQHEQPGHTGDVAVNIAADRANDTELTMVAPEVAAAVGRILLELDNAGRRALALALTDAAAVVLMGRATSPATPGSPVQREARPNTPGREAEPNDAATDGR